MHNLKQALPQSYTACKSRSQPTGRFGSRQPAAHRGIETRPLSWAQSPNEGQAAWTEEIIQDMDTEEGSSSKDSNSEEEDEKEPDCYSNKLDRLGTSQQPLLQSKICWKIRQLQSNMKRQSQLFKLEEAEDKPALFALKMRDFSWLNAIIGSSFNGRVNVPIEVDKLRQGLGAS